MHDVTYKILYSARHEFKYDERFHPGRGNAVALVGWRAVVEATCDGCSKVADVCVGLTEQETLQSAREFARDALFSV